MQLMDANYLRILNLQTKMHNEVFNKVIFYRQFFKINILIYTSIYSK